MLKTDSIPRTPVRPAEHYIAAVLGQPAFLEGAFARFKLQDGAGRSIVVSHRIYSEKVGDQMSAWLKANGDAMEKALMSWTDVPVPHSASQKASIPANPRRLKSHAFGPASQAKPRLALATQPTAISPLTAPFPFLVLVTRASHSPKPVIS